MSPNLNASNGLWMPLVTALTSIAILAFAPPSGAEEPPADNPYGLSEFEWRLVSRSMQERGLRPVTYEAAAGKRIERIEVVTEDPLTPEDPWPDIANLAHATSRPSVIRGELLFGVGDAYDKTVADESARNLRGPLILSIVEILPMRGSTDDSVVILVVTKDVWSLRINTNFLLVGEVLSFLSLSLSENNIFGLHKTGALTFLLEQDTLSFGEFYSDPRLFGSRFTLGESASVIVNRDSGKPEGFSAAAALNKPLFSLATRWGYGAGASGTRQVGRLFSGAQLRTFDDPDTAEVEELPFTYRLVSVGGDATVVRSFGKTLKHNISGGYDVSFTKFEYGEDDAQAAAFDRALIRSFEDAFLPRSETISRVFLRYTIFSADYAQARNINTFALPEDFRFGPSVTVSASHADPLIGATSRFETLGFSAVYRLALGAEPVDGLVPRSTDILQFSAGASTRIESGDLLDNELRLSAKNYSPPFLGGRLVVGLSGVHRVDDVSNRLDSVGGGTGLRGYASGQFLARSVISSNVEWRTLPIEIWTFHLGLAAFYDVAVIANEEDWADRLILHGTGFGLRWLNPASNRIVLRFDYGFPFGGPVSTLPGNFSFGFEQAF
jgi:hypothetical protein